MAALPRRLKDTPPRPSWAAVMSAEGLIKEVTAAAPFEIAEIDILDATLTLPTPVDMWRGMVGKPVTRTLVSQCDDDELQEVEHTVLQAFEDCSGAADRTFVLNASCYVLIARCV